MVVMHMAIVVLSSNLRRNCTRAVVLASQLISHLIRLPNSPLQFAFIEEKLAVEFGTQEVVLDRQGVLQTVPVLVDHIAKPFLSVFGRLLHDVGVVECAELGEVLPQSLVICGVRDVSNVDLGPFLVDGPLSLF